MRNAVRALQAMIAAGASLRCAPLGGATPALRTSKPERHLAFELVGDADNRALGDVRVCGEDLLDRTRREPVAGDVDDVVGTRHHEDIAVARRCSQRQRSGNSPGTDPGR